MNSETRKGIPPLRAIYAGQEEFHVWPRAIKTPGVSGLFPGSEEHTLGFLLIILVYLMTSSHVVIAE